MTEGFSNPIIGGGGALVYPAIHSPNFNEATQTGWSIDKNGNAFFYGIVTSGEFTGTDFIINSAGAFFYSGSPTAGNLIASIAATGGTDGFGNSYQAGLTSYDNVFGGVTQIDGAVMEQFDGVDLMSEYGPKGFFLYSPSAGAGKLIVSAASSSGSDAYGNAYPAGLGLSNSAAWLSFFDLASNYFEGPNITAIGSGGGLGAALVANSGLSDSSDANAEVVCYSKEYVSTNLGSYPAGPAVSLDGNVVVSNPAVQPFIYASNTSTGGIETAFKNLGSPASGWTTTGFARYKLLPDGTCLVEFQDITPPGTAPADASVIWTAANGLPAGYRPSSNRRIPCYANKMLAASGVPAFEFHTDGSIEVYGISGANPTRMDGEFEFSTI